MDDTNTTPETLAGDAHVTSADGGGTVQTVADKAGSDSFTLAEIQKIFPNVKTKEDALKSIEETKSFVGKRKEDYLKEISNTQNTDTLAKELKEIKENMFFKDNPQLAPYKGAFKKVGGNPEDFFNSPEFKPIFEKAKGYDESLNTRTVLESNPRLQYARDNLSQAKDALNAGRKETASDLAARAVIQAYGMES